MHLGRIGDPLLSVTWRKPSPRDRGLPYLTQRTSRTGTARPSAMGETRAGRGRVSEALTHCPFPIHCVLKKTLKEPKPPSPSLRCARSLSLPLSLVAPLLSPWPQVCPWGTAASECAPMGAGQRLRDALREGCCVLAGQNSPEPCTPVSHGSFLPCSKSAHFTPQSGRGRDGNTKGAAPQGVSRDEM